MASHNSTPPSSLKNQSSASASAKGQDDSSSTSSLSHGTLKETLAKVRLPISEPSSSAMPPAGPLPISIGDPDDDGSSGDQYSKHEFWGENSAPNLSKKTPLVEEVHSNTVVNSDPDSDASIHVPDQFTTGNEIHGYATQTPKSPVPQSRSRVRPGSDSPASSPGRGRRRLDSPAASGTPPSSTKRSGPP